jgi:hypothetical protein
MGAASSQPVLDPARALAPYSCASPVRSLPARHHTTTFGCSRRRNYLSYGCFDLRSGKCATGGRSRAPTSPATADVTTKHTRAALLCHHPTSVVVAPSPPPLLRLRLPRYYKHSNRMSWSCSEVQTSLRFRGQRGFCSHNILLA